MLWCKLARVYFKVKKLSSHTFMGNIIMKYIAIDFGIKRIGLAISSPNEVHIFPLCTYERTTRNALFDFLLNTFEKEGIEAIVIGLPLALDGSDTLTTSQVRNFSQSLKRRTSLPIYLINEALSSFEAEEELVHMQFKKRKKILDQASAIRILSSFFSHTKKETLLLL